MTYQVSEFGVTCDHTLLSPTHTHTHTHTRGCPRQRLYVTYKLSRDRRGNGEGGISFKLVMSAPVGDGSHCLPRFGFFQALLSSPNILSVIKDTILILLQSDR